MDHLTQLKHLTIKNITNIHQTESDINDTANDLTQTIHEFNSIITDVESLCREARHTINQIRILMTQTHNTLKRYKDTTVANNESIVFHLTAMTVTEDGQVQGN